MTRAEAYSVFGRRVPPQWELIAMCKALSMHSWHNTPEEWQRFEAAAALLGRRCPPRARLVLADHLAAGGMNADHA